NPSAPAFNFFIYVHCVPPWVDECLLFPEIYTDAPSGVGGDTATINGRVDGNCYDVDSVKFQYGKTTSYGTEAAAVKSGYNQYHAFLTGLTPQTEYHYRIVPY